MVNLRQRSYEKELLDQDDIPFTDIRRNMQELNFINTYLGGHAISIRGLQYFMPVSHIAEIGCGGGDNIHALNSWLNNKKLSATFTGIDIKKECIDFARTRYPQLPVNWITSDYKMAVFKKPEVIFTSLFCHHFTDEELVYMMQWMKQHAAKGFFINDLHRNRVAYYAIKWLTRLFSRSYMVKHDAALSVARGFKKHDWKNIMNRAGITNYKVKWKWAFRYLVLVKNE